MRVGAYVLEASGLYLWHAEICPSCRTEWPSGRCHHCGAEVRAKTWEDLGYNPPPWDPLTHKIEELAGRVMVDRRVSMVELELALRPEGLGVQHQRMAENLVRAYASGTARAAQQRLDEIQAKTGS